MLLAETADVISQLGFDSMTDINFAVSMAMDAAEPYLSAQLNTGFEKGTYVDTFFVREPRYRDGPAVSTEFRLRRGLVSSITSVLTNADPCGFGNLSADTLTKNITDHVTLHSDKGVVKDFKTHYMSQWVQITYVAGFDTDPNTANSYLISEVPDWLQNACKIKTLIGLVDSPVLSEAQIKLDPRLLTQQLVSLLSRHLRYAPLSLLPL